jgi:precorrin-6B methylase 2
MEVGLSDPIHHWYYMHKFRSIMQMLSEDLDKANCLIDVGAGQALFSLQILRLKPRLKVIAIDPGYLRSEQIDESNRITYLRSGYGVSG